MSDDKNLSPFIYQYQKTLGELERKAQMSAWKWMDNDLSVTLSNATIQNGGETALRCDNAELCLPQADAIRLRDYLNKAYPIDEVTDD
ncbi:hypothetical protein [Psychrobacter arcticus]|uniref:hypothetical protein n=1 Tax=Psychrobacter arcticus TaxID=334543 RepID=UPI0002DE2F24|nr:hypothetical protein [Psychrobacter arcticus]